MIAACLAVMVVLVFGNVVLRYAFNSGITVSEELSRWLFVWLTFLGSYLCGLREQQNISARTCCVDPLVQKAGSPVSWSGTCFMLWVCWLLFAGALAQTRMNWDVTAPSSGPPWPGFTVSEWSSAFGRPRADNDYRVLSGDASEAHLRVREEQL